MVREFSMKAYKDLHLTKNFTVAEFACHDGSDTVFVDEGLVLLLQKIRDHFEKPITINSGYRTDAYNAKVGGVPGSQHTLGTAADIVVKGISPLQVAQFAEHLIPTSGGIGLYKDFVHVDTRPGRGRWDNRSGKEVGVDGFPGYAEETPEPVTVYGTLKDVPKVYQPTLRKLLQARVFVGYEIGDPNDIEDNVLNVTEEFCRILLILDQIGLFDSLKGGEP